MRKGPRVVLITQSTLGEVSQCKKGVVIKRTVGIRA